MSFGFGFSPPAWQALSGGFTPASLFSLNEQGTWYDPSDYGPTGSNGVGTLFQDSAGTTPVTGVEQVVGLMLDKSKGLVLGPELVTNGDFSQGSLNWTAGTGWSISGGLATGTSATGNLLQTNVAINPIGKTYKVTLTISGRTAGSIVPQIGGSQITLSSDGTYTFFLRPSLNDATFYIPGSNFSGSVDNVSVREIPGNHATATGSARPTLSARVNLLTKTEQFDDAVWLSNAATVTPNTVLAPNNTLTADSVNFTDTIPPAAAVRIYQDSSTLSVNGVSYVGSIWMRADSDRTVVLTIQRAGPADTQSVTCNVTTSWQRFSLTHSGVWTGSSAVRLNVNNPSQTGVIYVWGADLRVANDGVGIPAYQRVNTATDYDTAGFPVYLAFGGAQAMSTPANVDFATVTSDGQARRNLLNNPTQFDVTASWVTTNSSIVPNAAVAPDGTTSGDKLVENTASSTHQVYQNYQAPTAGISLTFSIFAKAAERTVVTLLEPSATERTFNLISGVATGSGASMQDVGNGWWRCIASGIAPDTANRSYAIRLNNGSGTTYTGDGTSGLFIWGAQLEVGSTATAFQNIGTDKMTVFAGVRKLSDAATAVFVELSADATANNGAFNLTAPTIVLSSYRYLSRGTSNSFAGTGNFARAPISNVITGIGDINGDVSTLRSNGVEINAAIADQGTGNYGSYPLFIGARNLASLFFTGRLYSLITRGAATDSASVAATEAWVNQRTAAY